MLGPLVTCLMPTFDRRTFVPLAIEGFLRQDFPDRELVILDDGTDPVADLIPDDPNVRYERLTCRIRLGTKRNQACQMARGEILLHWDDDDWYASNRISRQVQALTAAGADVCGVSSLLFYDPIGPRAWRYRYPERAKPWVAGTSLCYTRAFWEHHHFDAVSTGEDTRFLWRSGSRRILVLNEPAMVVATVHGRNTSRNNMNGSRWHPTPVAEVSALLGEDDERYRAAAHGRITAHAESPVPALQAAGGRASAMQAGMSSRPSMGLPADLSSLRMPPYLAISEDAAAVSVPPPPTVTVSIPYFGCKHLLRRAVRSVLDQTFRDLRVVVVNDGDADPPWNVLADLDDPRLVRFDLPHNVGRYFADTVVLGASASPYFLVQDADDWSEPRRVERLLDSLVEERAIAAVSATALHPMGARRGVRVEKPQFRLEPISERLIHRADHHGLFSREALLGLGGSYGGMRLGFDTLLMNLLLMTGTVAFVDEVLYHRQLRPDSLTHSAATGFGSAARTAAVAEVKRRYRSAVGNYRSLEQGIISREQLVTRLRDLTSGAVTPLDRACLTSETERLAALLAPQVECGSPTNVGVVAAVATSPRVPDIGKLLRELPWGDGWALPRSTAVELAEGLRRSKAQRILEAGSGLSTVMLAAYAARLGGRVLSLEHDPRYAERTRRLLRRWGLAEVAEVRLARLETRPCGTEFAYPWYQTSLEGAFDMFLIDGPPMSIGRQAAMFAVADHRTRDWQLWLHDAHRDHERQCLELWRGSFSFACSVYDTDDAGLAILSSGTGPPGRPAVSGIGVSILTGHRPALFQRSMGALQQRADGLLRTVPVVVLINGSDPETEHYARSLPFVDEVIATAGAIAGVGEATSRVIEALLAGGDLPYVLHLEDDWFACSVDNTWAERAISILGADEMIGQVRLRHRSDTVLTRHMVTGRPISWEERDGFLYSPSAHFTFNPSLTRAAELRTLLPCASEAEAQRRFLATGLGVAQMIPGMFRHIGDQQSLRRRLGR
ncbi:MAG: glycosyltransferase [Hyphomicrobiales bacterium]|nr:MAG: glycosyltransferase [Hyphomicrobiales bacterium]